MQITLSVDGGLASFPGLRKARTLDVDALPAPERDRICALIEAVFKAPPVAHPHAPGAADLRTYTLDIDDAGQRTTIAASDPITDERLSTLVQMLRAHLDRR